MAKFSKSGIVFYLALIGLSWFKIIGLLMGSITGAVVAVATNETNTPSSFEYFVWCIG